MYYRMNDVLVMLLRIGRLFASEPVTYSYNNSTMVSYIVHLAKLMKSEEAPYLLCTKIKNTEKGSKLVTQSMLSSHQRTEKSKVNLTIKSRFGIYSSDLTTMASKF